MALESVETSQICNDFEDAYFDLLAENQRLRATLERQIVINEETSAVLRIFRRWVGIGFKDASFVRRVAKVEEARGFIFPSKQRRSPNSSANSILDQEKSTRLRS